MSEKHRHDEMIHIVPAEMPLKELYGYLIGGIAPRPIALVSTVSADGAPNLSPFSYFNLFGANPPTIAFSATRRGRDGTTKDTYRNLMETKECVVQAVTYAMVQQVSLASTEYPSGTDEFVKTGLTPVASELVTPARVKESPYQLECRLQQMIALGDGPGSGNLAVCEVIKIHVSPDILVDGQIDPQRIDLVGRNGGDFYTRASGDAIFSVAKPVGKSGVGFDRLPEYILHSHVLSANNLAQLANCERIPDAAAVQSFLDAGTPIPGDIGAFRRHHRLGDYKSMFGVARHLLETSPGDASWLLETTARCALDQEDPEFAWHVIGFIPMMTG